MLQATVDIQEPISDEFVKLFEYLDEDSKAKLIASAQEVLVNYWDLRLGQFFDVQKERLDCIGVEGLNVQTVAQFIWVQGFPQFVDTLCNTLKRLEVKQSVEERKASASLMKMSFEEAALIFLQRYFGLPSFLAAREITLGEYVMAKKAEYNRGTFERAMAEIQRKKIKKK